VIDVTVSRGRLSRLGFHQAGYAAIRNADAETFGGVSTSAPSVDDRCRRNDRRSPTHPAWWAVFQPP
jgi:hypothetical protein